MITKKSEAELRKQAPRTGYEFSGSHAEAIDMFVLGELRERLAFAQKTRSVVGFIPPRSLQLLINAIDYAWPGIERSIDRDYFNEMKGGEDNA